jgi:two-component system, response regulator YesN
MNGQKILVLGDDSHLFRTISWVLEYKGYYVRLARRAGAALARLIEEDFDLVIARLNMEDLQRLDVLERARRINPGVKLMVVSGNLNAAFPLEAYRIEVDDYLLLPVNALELVRRVGECLKPAEAPGKAGPQELVQELTGNEKISGHLQVLRQAVVEIGKHLAVMPEIG